MVFGKGARPSKFALLALIPVVVDGLSMLIGMAMHGFSGSSHLSFKLALQMGLPSISAVTEQGFLPGTVQLSTSGGLSESALLGALLSLVLFLVVQSFLQSGYIGLLQDAAAGHSLSMRSFASYGSRFFGRFLMLNLLVMVFLLALGGATAFLQLPGAILMIVVFLWLRVLFLYLEYTIIADDCTIAEAFSRSRETFRRRSPATMSLVILMFMINIVAGFLVNYLWFPLFFLLFLVVYDIVSSRMQLAFMHDFRNIRGL
ncbi:hypothetical protein [Paenibacillus montanisoli]|uniref:DUF975 domain-containing protein n=1 Tax=Paenibacillus montanisoli TaxID=2081970 RepID=A0A328U4I9_9BACL|nr:hypothetical protein [Paenibacillus montanisoli]RAP74776.1 hypothetical protein DL346_22315 [Paenibacillus montanisoli]